MDQTTRTRIWTWPSLNSSIWSTYPNQYIYETDVNKLQFEIIDEGFWRAEIISIRAIPNRMTIQELFEAIDIYYRICFACDPKRYQPVTERRSQIKFKIKHTNDTGE